VTVPCVGLASCTGVDGVGPSPAASPAVAPGAGGGVCCVPLPGLPIVAPAARAPPASATVFPPPFLIVDRNRFPTVPPPLRAPTLVTAARHRARALLTGRTSALSPGTAPFHHFLFFFIPVSMYVCVFYYFGTLVEFSSW
jgi:hypothetical protein